MATEEHETVTLPRDAAETLYFLSGLSYGIMAGGVTPSRARLLAMLSGTTDEEMKGALDALRQAVGAPSFEELSDEHKALGAVLAGYA